MVEKSGHSEEVGRRAWDEISIVSLLSRLSQAQDNRDFDGYRGCFTDTVLIDNPMIPGWKPTSMSADEYTNTGLPMLAEFEATHHRLFNHVIDVQGDEATCVVDLSAVHLLKVGNETKTWTLGGRYHMRLRRGAGGWLICERALRVRYQLGDLTLIDKVIARAKAKAANGTPPS